MAKETANNGNGWICLHRAFKDWQHYGEPSVMVVFIDLLLSVNAKDGWWHGHKCERGATFRSIRSIAEDTTLNPITIRRAFAKLEETGEIKRIKIDQKHTKTIVCNFAKYQDFGGVSVLKNNTLSNTQSNTQSNTKQQYNKENNIVVEENNNTHTHEELIKDLFSRDNTIQAFCMNERITLDQCRKYAEAVVIEWQLTDETHNNRSQAIKHLLAQIRKKAECDRERGITFKAKNERLQPMIDFCKQLLKEGQSRDDVSAWFSYWTEDCNDNSGRMRFEAEKAWDNRTRYINFLKRKKK